MNKIVFSDLDGTLLDHATYEYSEAQDAIKLLQHRIIPLLFCTSKTCAEIQYWQDELAVYHPFISENGGGIFIPKTYFDFDIEYDYEDAVFYVIQLGADIEKLLQVMGELKEKFEVDSFAEMSVDEIADDAQLPRHLADLAKRRDYDLPFKIQDPSDEQNIREEIMQHRLRCIQGGRYYHLMGNNDKGHAVEILTKIFSKKLKSIETIGIGDSDNDFSMLDVVERPYLVQRPDKSYASKKYIQTKGIGPAGWKNVIFSEFSQK